MERNTNIKHKLYLSLIIFSFIWVIIGDLVSMHMRVISHIDLQQHSPFANIHKVEKQGKQKNAKYFDEGFNFNTDFVSLNEYTVNPLLNFVEIVSPTTSILHSNENLTSFSGRAPPSFV
jgi:hypothetical protein